jgi:hypothetical protein
VIEQPLYSAHLPPALLQSTTLLFFPVFTAAPLLHPSVLIACRCWLRGSAADNPEAADEQRTNTAGIGRPESASGGALISTCRQILDTKQGWGAWDLRGSQHAGNGAGKRAKDVNGMMEKEAPAREKRGSVRRKRRQHGKSAGASGGCFVASHDSDLSSCPAWHPTPLKGAFSWVFSPRKALKI